MPRTTACIVDLMNVNIACVSTKDHLKSYLRYNLQKKSHDYFWTNLRQNLKKIKLGKTQKISVLRYKQQERKWRNLKFAQITFVN